jgi:hypothetical protein
VLGSRAPTMLLSEEGVNTRNKVNNAMLRYGKSVLGSMTEEERAFATSMAMGRGTPQDVLNGLETMGAGIRAEANTRQRKYPAHIQAALRRANPNLFTPETSGKRPGQ